MTGWPEKWRPTVDKALNYLALARKGGLAELGLKHTVPQGSYFVMVDISDFLAKEKFSGWTDLQFCEWMVKEVGVAAVPGSSFFAEPVNHLIRLHFARSEESLREAVRRLGLLKKYL